jgi:exodeoxyribonuclease-3
MKIISWNVNGLRACVRKGFMDFFNSVEADIFCVQEIKMQPGQLELQLPGYYQYLNSADKKGYSGTAVFTRIKPLSIKNDIGILEHSFEGRVITVEYESFYLVNVYTPNAQDKLARIDYRMRWEDDFREYVKGLNKNKPVIICGDLNVAHNEIDLKNPDSNRGNAGFSDEERGKITKLLSEGFVDTFRWFYPEKEDAYTWWTYRFNARANNIGWRIDYFLASKRLMPLIEDSIIYPEILGSDHCPVGILISDSIKDLKPKDNYEVYVDGSYNGNVGYGVVVLKNGELLEELSGLVTDPIFTGSRQVGGEIIAVMEALKWFKDKKNNNTVNDITIYYDFENLKKWAKGEFQTNIPMSKIYKDFVQKSGMNIIWKKVAAHTGLKWNEKADELAKKGTFAGAVSLKENPSLIEELKNIAEEFAQYLEDNGYIAEFLNIYNEMYAKICIEKEGEQIGYINIYNTKKLHLQPRYHEVKESKDKKNIEGLWENFSQDIKI